VQDARDRYLAGLTSVGELEDEIADALKPVRYSERVEVHVYGAPPGAALHLHV
jgi:hypothetical protein